MVTFSIEEKGIHPSWRPFFTPEVLQLIQSIENQIVGLGYFTPLPQNVLRFLSLDLMAVKVLILGQDPYPQPGRATGRAFEVGGLQSWLEPFENASLRNIVRAIYKAYEGDILSFNQVREKIQNSLFEPSFTILPPHKLFKSWEEQGVLLLNTAFTCELDKPGSHSKLWQPFTLALLAYINANNPQITWFIWGAHAEKVVRGMCISNKLVNAHPMLAVKKESDMVYGSLNPFFETKLMVNWLG